MAELTEKQVDCIEIQIKKDISIRTLRVELLDHYCCLVEELMDKGQNFDAAFAQAFQTISPNGMAEIEEETFFLLTFNRQTTMKKLLYLSGFVASFCLLAGLLMKILHWPFANIVSFVGSGSLIFAMLVLTAMMLRNLKFFNSSDIFRTASGALGGLCVGMGFILKIMHWPGANMLTFVGTVIICFLFLPVLFWKMYKHAV